MPQRFDTQEGRLAALKAGVSPRVIGDWVVKNLDKVERPEKRQRLDAAGSSKRILVSEFVTNEEQVATKPKTGASYLDTGDNAVEMQPCLNSEPGDNGAEQSNEKAENLDSDAGEIVQQASMFARIGRLRFRGIRNLAQRLLCMISVNNGGVFGSFNPGPKGWAVQLYLDAGRYASPTMKMSFRSDGPDGKKEGIIGWNLSDVLEDDWMVKDLKIYRVADHPEDKRISHKEVLPACQDSAEIQRLIYISFEAWPKILLHDQKNQFKNPGPYVKKLLKAVFQGRHQYHMRICFLAPAGSEEKLEK